MVPSELDQGRSATLYPTDNAREAIPSGEPYSPRLGLVQDGDPQAEDAYSEHLRIEGKK